MAKKLVGIDIAKNLHFASIVDSNGEVFEKAFPFENNKAGFELLMSCMINLYTK